MNREEKLRAIQDKVRDEGYTLTRIARDTALSINTVRNALNGDAKTLDSTVNFLYLYLGLKPEQKRTKRRKP